jgi:hypothetical protein
MNIKTNKFSKRLFQLKIQELHIFNISSLMNNFDVENDL